MENKAEPDKLAKAVKLEKFLVRAEHAIPDRSTARVSFSNEERILLRCVRLMTKERNDPIRIRPSKREKGDNPQVSYYDIFANRENQKRFFFILGALREGIATSGMPLNTDNCWEIFFHGVGPYNEKEKLRKKQP